MFIICRDLMYTTSHHCLRRPILVNQPGGGRVHPPGGELVGKKCFSSDDECPGESCHFLGRQQLIERFQMRRSDFDKAEIMPIAQSRYQRLDALCFWQQYYMLTYD